MQTFKPADSPASDILLPWTFMQKLHMHTLLSTIDFGTLSGRSGLWRSFLQMRCHSARGTSLIPKKLFTDLPWMYPAVLSKDFMKIKVYKTIIYNIFLWNANPTGSIKWFLSTKPGRRLLSRRSGQVRPARQIGEPFSGRAQAQKASTLHGILYKIKSTCSMYSKIRWKICNVDPKRLDS